MSNVFDKRTFKNKDKNNKLINLKNIKLFNKFFGEGLPFFIMKCISLKWQLLGKN